jgi:hypothetical protein
MLFSFARAGLDILLDGGQHGKPDKTKPSGSHIGFARGPNAAEEVEMSAIVRLQQELLNWDEFPVFTYFELTEALRRVEAKEWTPDDFRQGPNGSRALSLAGSLQVMLWTREDPQAPQKALEMATMVEQAIEELPQTQ